MNIENKLLLFYLSLDDSEKQKFKRLLSSKARNILANPEIRSIRSYLNRMFNDIERLTDRQDRPKYQESIPYSREYNKSSHMERDSAMMQIVRRIEDTTNSNLSLAETIESLTGTKITRKEKRSKSELRGILIDEFMNSPKSKLLKIKNQLIKKIRKSQLVPESESNLDKWFSIILESKK